MTYHLSIGLIEKFGARIMTLNTNLSRVAEKSKIVENVLVIIKPLSTIDVVESVVTGADYLKHIKQLIKSLTQLEDEKFEVKEDYNPLVGELDYQHVFVTLPSRDYVEKVYRAQPFFGCLIAHKLSHI